MKKITPVLCALLICAGLFSSCRNDDRGDGTGHMYNVSLLGNPESLDPQFADDPSSNTVIKNLYSGLVMTDSSGNISCCNAESYTVSDDGLVYTFYLRHDNYWFFDKNNDDYIDDDEYFPVTADDYVFAFRRLLDPAMKSPFAWNFSCIRDGEAILNGFADPTEAGVFALDDFTLVLTLDYPSAEFLALLTTSAAYPCNEEFFNSTKGRYGLDDRSVMSNGAFYVRQWFYDPYGVNNILYMRKNEVNSRENYDVSPSYLSFTIEKDENDIRKLFKENEIDCFTTLDSSAYNPSKYSVSGQSAVTLGLIFNPDDEYFKSINLRKALAKSVDRSELRINSDMSIAYGIIPPASKLLGRSYRELVSDNQFNEYNIEEASKCLEEALKELNIGSIESVKILACAADIDSGCLHQMSQLWQERLNVYIGIEDVTSDEFEKRIAEGDYSIAVYALKGGNSSGLSVIEQFGITDCLKYVLGSDDISKRLMSCPTVSELVDCYTAVEHEILGSYGFIPLFYKKSYLIARKENEEIIYDPFTGAVDYRTAKNYS